MNHGVTLKLHQSVFIHQGQKHSTTSWQTHSLTFLGLIKLHGKELLQLPSAAGNKVDIVKYINF